MMSFSVLQAGNITAWGQETEREVAAVTVKEEAQVRGVVLQSSVAESAKSRLTAPPHT